MRILFKYLRIAVLMVLLAGTVNLWHWSHTNDPRFYRFTHSPGGHVLARVMQWEVHQAIQPLHKDESEMTSEELATKRKLEQNAFRQPMPDGTLPAISYRDVRFKMEHPTLRLYRFPPYSVMSDEAPEIVKDYLAQLDQLHGRFTRIFSSLLNRADRQDGIQVLLFHDHRNFVNYQHKVAPALGESAGFYSPHLDRFILYNQASLFKFTIPVADTAPAQVSFNQARATAFWSADIQQQVTLDAQRETSQTLRHEGAHQLFHAYGVHSDIRAENTWLLEGLAAYCEPSIPGARLPLYASELKLHRNDFIALQDLLANRSLKGFFEYENTHRTQLAYAQSWSLVHMLMQPEYRHGFFSYIKYIRDCRHTDDLVRSERIEILADFLDLKSRDLEKLWRQYAAAL